MPKMSTIPISLTEKQFDEHIRPYISTAKRGFECKIPLYKIFNYILYRLHTGCQWYQLPIACDPASPEKKEISYDAVITIFASGAGMAAYKRSGKAVL
jgi:transposase